MRTDNQSRASASSERLKAGAPAPACRKIHGWILLAFVFWMADSSSADQFGDFTYTDNGTSITITDYPTTAIGPVVIPDSIVGKPVKAIGDYAFYKCSEMSSVTIPSSVTTIGNWAFYYCIGLSGLTLPPGVTGIGTGAFYSCGGLTNMAIPSGVSLIGDNAFDSCVGLKSISVHANNPRYSAANGVLFNKSKTVLIRCPQGASGAYVIPSSVISIESGAFYSCSGLTGNVTIPAGVTSIEADTFRYCRGLTSLTIPSTVTSIGSSAFTSCGGLYNLTFPPGVIHIGDHAFYDCTGLSSVTIPSSVSSIGFFAFYNCRGLTNATFIGAAPTVGANAFHGAAAGFTVYFFDGKMGFTSPTWLGYPAVNMGAETSAKTWLIAGGFPYDSNLQSDPNSDGVNLLMAYALNLDPNQNLSGSIPQPVFTAGEMSLSFYAGTAGVAYTVEASGNMVDWSADGVTISGPDANNIRTATVERTGPLRFMRLAVSH